VDCQEPGQEQKNGGRGFQKKGGKRWGEFLWGGARAEVAMGENKAESDFESAAGGRGRRKEAGGASASRSEDDMWLHGEEGYGGRKTEERGIENTGFHKKLWGTKRHPRTQKL